MYLFSIFLILCSIYIITEIMTLIDLGVTVQDRFANCIIFRQRTVMICFMMQVATILIQGFNRSSPEC